jgi:hypothetical protein
MNGKTTKGILKAVGLRLIILIIIGTIIQNAVSIEIGSNEKISIKNNYILSRSNNKQYLIQGSGEISYIYPENIDNFFGQKWENDLGYGINGWINETNIIVDFSWDPGFNKPSYIFAICYQTFRLFFRILFPKSFTIINFTGNIYCSYYSIPHGPAGTEYTISGIADSLIL